MAQTRPPVFVATMPSLVGELLLTSDGTALTGIHMRPDDIGPEDREDWVEGGCKLLDEARRQLTEYFAGTRQAFNLPLRSGGSEFQQRVWTADHPLRHHDELPRCGSAHP